eukprot:2852095-Rhodomonas_salina.4
MAGRPLVAMHTACSHIASLAARKSKAAVRTRKCAAPGVLGIAAFRRECRYAQRPCRLCSRRSSLSVVTGTSRWPDTTLTSTAATERCVVGSLEDGAARAAAQQGLQAVLPPELAAALALCLAVAGQHRLGVGRDGLAADVDAGQRRRERREYPERRAAAAGRAGAGQPEERAPAALGTLPGRKQPPPELRDLGPVQQLRY